MFDLKDKGQCKDEGKLDLCHRIRNVWIYIFKCLLPNFSYPALYEKKGKQQICQKFDLINWRSLSSYWSENCLFLLFWWKDRTCNTEYSLCRSPEDIVVRCLTKIGDRVLSGRPLPVNYRRCRLSNPSLNLWPAS